MHSTAQSEPYGFLSGTNFFCRRQKNLHRTNAKSEKDRAMTTKLASALIYWVIVAIWLAVLGRVLSNHLRLTYLNRMMRFARPALLLDPTNSRA